MAHPPVQTAAAPSRNNVLVSLKTAADTAHATFTAVAMIDPVAAKPLWVDAINLTNIYLSALQEQLVGAPADVSAAKAALDAQTGTINNQLATLNNVATTIGLITALVQFAITLSKFFA